MQDMRLSGAQPGRTGAGWGRGLHLHPTLAAGRGESVGAWGSWTRRGTSKAGRAMALGAQHTRLEPRLSATSPIPGEPSGGSPGVVSIPVREAAASLLLALPVHASVCTCLSVCISSPLPMGRPMHIRVCGPCPALECRMLVVLLCIRRPLRLPPWALGANLLPSTAHRGCRAWSCCMPRCDPALPLPWCPARPGAGAEWEAIGVVRHSPATRWAWALGWCRSLGGGHSCSPWPLTVPFSPQSRGSQLGSSS